jgi:hypothetical protein
MIPALIIGNGTTRKEFDLDRISDPGLFITYSCGIAYKDFKNGIPDYHVTVEQYRKEQLEFNNLDHILFPQTDIDHYELVEYHGSKHRFNSIQSLPRNNTGMFAMKCAILDGCEQIYILGFDSLIKSDNKQSTSNCFEGREETRTRVEDNINRAQYLDWFCMHNILHKFIFVFPASDYEYHTITAPNVEAWTYDAFEEMLNET